MGQWEDQEDRLPVCVSSSSLRQSLRIEHSAAPRKDKGSYQDAIHSCMLKLWRCPQVVQQLAVHIFKRQPVPRNSHAAPGVALLEVCALYFTMCSHDT